MAKLSQSGLFRSARAWKISTIPRGSFSQGSMQARLLELIGHQHPTHPDHNPIPSTFSTHTTTHYPKPHLPQSHSQYAEDHYEGQSHWITFFIWYWELGYWVLGAMRGGHMYIYIYAWMGSNEIIGAMDGEQWTCLIWAIQTKSNPPTQPTQLTNLHQHI